MELTKEDDSGTWEKGYIIDPDEGEMYDAKVWMEDNKLHVRGYIGIFFDTQTWLKSTKEEAYSGAF